MKSVQRIERNEDSASKQQECAPVAARAGGVPVWASHVIAMVFCRRGSSGLIRFPALQSVQAPAPMMARLPQLTECVGLCPSCSRSAKLARRRSSDVGSANQRGSGPREVANARGHRSQICLFARNEPRCCRNRFIGGFTSSDTELRNRRTDCPSCADQHIAD